MSVAEVTRRHRRRGMGIEKAARAKLTKKHPEIYRQLAEYKSALTKLRALKNEKRRREAAVSRAMKTNFYSATQEEKRAFTRADRDWSNYIDQCVPRLGMDQLFDAVFSPTTDRS